MVVKFNSIRFVSSLFPRRGIIQGFALASGASLLGKPAGHLHLLASSSRLDTKRMGVKFTKYDIFVAFLFWGWVVLKRRRRKLNVS